MSIYDWERESFTPPYDQYLEVNELQAPIQAERRLLGGFLRGSILPLSVVAACAVSFTAGKSWAEPDTSRRDAAGITSELKDQARSVVELEGSISFLAHKLTGEDVAVRCENIGRSSQFAGYKVSGMYTRTVAGKSPKITLTPEICLGIIYNTSMPYSADDPTKWGDTNAILSVRVIAHEIAHASGISDEGEANCRGAEYFHAVAHGLGIRAAIEVADPKELYAKSAAPAIYHSAGC
jgi:hypothetical protein